MNQAATHLKDVFAPETFTGARTSFFVPTYFRPDGEEHGYFHAKEEVASSNLAVELRLGVAQLVERLNLRVRLFLGLSFGIDGEVRRYFNGTGGCRFESGLLAHVGSSSIGRAPVKKALHTLIPQCLSLSRMVKVRVTSLTKKTLPAYSSGAFLFEGGTWRN